MLKSENMYFENFVIKLFFVTQNRFVTVEDQYVNLGTDQ